MNNNLLFFAIASSLLILSIITVNIAPIISKATTKNYFDEWGTGNCQILEDEYKRKKDIDKIYDDENSKKDEVLEKRRINECKNHKTMYSLEYAALVVDITLGFICSLLGLIHFIEPGKPFEKYSGLIGLIVGIITSVLTVIYVAFSANIFTNEPVRGIPILYPNKASLHFNGEKYIFDYDEDKAADEDLDIQFIKYKDLGKKQYNYDSEIFQSSKDSDSEYNKCKGDVYQKETFQKPILYTINGHQYQCLYIWVDQNEPENKSTENKYLFDRWLTSIILGVFIAVCGIGLAIFGFLLFKNSKGPESAPSSVPVQQ